MVLRTMDKTKHGRQYDMWGTGLPTVSKVVKKGIPERL